MRAWYDSPGLALGSNDLACEYTQSQISVVEFILNTELPAVTLPLSKRLRLPCTFLDGYTYGRHLCELRCRHAVR